MSNRQTKKEPLKRFSWGDREKGTEYEYEGHEVGDLLRNF